MTTPGSEWRTRLHTAIDRTGKKHSSIAEQARIRPESLGRSLTGTTTRPPFETIVRIAHAAGETVGWMLNERGYALSDEQRRELRNATAIIIAATTG